MTKKKKHEIVALVSVFCFALLFVAISAGSVYACECSGFDPNCPGGNQLGQCVENYWCPNSVPGSDSCQDEDPCWPQGAQCHLSFQ